MTNHSLKNRWTNNHMKAFINLKAEMTSELVLRRPKWDSTPFIITTDGSQDAFSAVLTQKFEYTLPSRKVIHHQHPLGFASKRSSKTGQICRHHVGLPN